MATSTAAAKGLVLDRRRSSDVNQVDMTPSSRVQPLDIDSAAWRLAIGRAIAKAIALAGWGDNHKVAAAAIDVDEGELAKWISGVRRPHLDKLFAVPELRLPLILTLGESSGVAQTEYTMRLLSAAPPPRPLRMGLK